MTRSSKDVELVLKLHNQGLPKAAIAREVDVSRDRVRAWILQSSESHDELIRRHQGGGVGQQPCGGDCELWTDLPPASYALLLGYYLGDGYIAKHRKGVFNLRITCSNDYPWIMDETDRMLQSVNPGRKVFRVSYPGHTDVISAWKHWPCVFPQHGAGTKHTRIIAFRGWQFQIMSQFPEFVLRGLINADGCRINNRVQNRKYSYPRYCFSNASKDIQNLFKWLCNQLEITWRRNHERMLSVSRKEDVGFLDLFVGPKQ